MSDYTPSVDRVRNMYARIMKPDGTVELASRRQKEFDRWLADHDRALREQIAREILARGCRHPGYLAIPFAEIYARIARGEGDAHRPERCPTCGCELAYPTAVHVVDCGEGSE